MFKEFIIKRVDPRNNVEKIEAIFFEEKINERIAEKKMFGKTKIREQNKLLSSKDGDSFIVSNEDSLYSLTRNNNLFQLENYELFQETICRKGLMRKLLCSV